MRRIYNIVAQATGFGITRNVIDRYAATIRFWEPGDRIYLFGFSRGAYTARCVAEVLALCGIPRKTKDGQPLALDQASVRKVAKHAVKHIYQFTTPRPPGEAKGKQTVLEATRLRLAATFRSDHAARYGAGDGTYPHFVGVFDTVAALINPTLAAGLAMASAVVAVILAFISSLLFSAFGDHFATFGWSLAVIAGAGIAAAAAAYVYEHFKIDWEGWFAPDRSLPHGLRREPRSRHRPTPSTRYRSTRTVSPSPACRGATPAAIRRGTPKDGCGSNRCGSPATTPTSAGAIRRTSRAYPTSLWAECSTARARCPAACASIRPCCAAGRPRPVRSTTRSRPDSAC